MLASSRGHCGGVRSRGRDKSRPYESILCFGPTGKTRRRGVLREGHGPPLQTGVSIEVNRETANRPTPQTRVGADSISARFAAPQTPAGGINPAPTNDFYVLSQPGKRRAANARPNGTVITLRAAVGRGALTSPDPAVPQTPAGGYGIRPYVGFAALETRGFLFNKQNRPPPIQAMGGGLFDVCRRLCQNYASAASSRARMARRKSSEVTLRAGASPSHIAHRSPVIVPDSIVSMVAFSSASA